MNAAAAAPYAVHTHTQPITRSTRVLLSLAYVSSTSAHIINMCAVFRFVYFDARVKHIVTSSLPTPLRLRRLYAFLYGQTYARMCFQIMLILLTQFNLCLTKKSSGISCNLQLYKQKKLLCRRRIVVHVLPQYLVGVS